MVGDFGSRALDGPRARPGFLSELYYSAAHLQQFTELNADFDVELHRRIKRVAFTDQLRVDFEEGAVVGAASSDGEEAPVRTPLELQGMLESYAERVKNLEVARQAMDEESVEQLRQLGYIK